jgi:hypothetical protein
MGYHTGCPQHSQLLRDRGLGHTQTLSHVFDVALLLHQPGHQLQPHRVAKRLERHRKPLGPGSVYAAFHMYF